MPVQHTLFGRPIPRISPRRTAVLLAGIALFALFTLVFTLPKSIPAGPSLSKFTDGHRLSIPKLPKKLPSASILNPFRPAAHAPPVQKNSTSGDASWYTDWKWLSPFSSSVTLDENRSLLPPLPERPAVYTYYDHTIKKDAATRDAEGAILLTWRRAWWAQGFKPVILGNAEAMNNPLYEELQRLQLEPALQTEMAKWLAWENMGTGLLINYLALPMGSHEDPLLSYLRRGEYPHLTRYEGMGNAFFAGPKSAITDAVKAALKNPALKAAVDFIGAVPPDTFHIDPAHDAIAVYDPVTVTSKYSKVAEHIVSMGPKGLEDLNQLMNAHLHNTWQNAFSSGVAILKPMKSHMTAIVEPAQQLATFLAGCSESIMPASCPPNRPNCKPCVASVPMKVTKPAQFNNASTLYTLGVVPHPYTYASLDSQRDTVDVRYIRRKSTRDPWLSTATKELLGTGVSGAPRVIKLKEAIASEYGRAHSLWVTAERDMPNDLDWHFGFTIPRNATDTGVSETPVPGPERRPKPPTPDIRQGLEPTATELEAERELLRKAKQVGLSKVKEQIAIKQAIEAWNLADTEAWRFARAYRARSTVERKQWEEEENKFAGGAGADSSASNGWGRWFDQ